MQLQSKLDQGKFKYIPLNDLLYDPENPRIPRKYSGADEISVIQYMLRDASILELMGAIAQVGFFPGEPLLIVPAPQYLGANKYFVVEGNRRLTAVKLLLNPGLATLYNTTIQEIALTIKEPESLQELPVIEYKDKAEVLSYLGYRHVTGIKEWGTFEKAQYLDTLALTQPYYSMGEIEKYKALSQAIGSRPEYVARLLTARELYNRAESQSLISPDELDTAQENFSLLTTSLYYGGIADYLNIDPKDVHLEGLEEVNFGDLLNWIFKKSDESGKAVVTESRKLKELNLIVQNDVATAYLKETGDLNMAAMMAVGGTKLDTYRSHLSNILKLLKNANKIIDSNSLELTQEDLELTDHIVEDARELNRTAHKLLK